MSDEIRRSVEARWSTIEPFAATIERDPRSTIAPSAPGMATRDRAGVAMLHEIGQGGSQGLVVERTLGQGGMGVVQLATQRSVGRKVAIKTTREVGDVRASGKLLREAWITGALEHPNVVPVYDVAVSEAGAPLVVMKRIEGALWSDLVSDPGALRERFGVRDPLEWNLRTLVQVMNALVFAHDRGILHRDLKPENVMIGRFGEVYVLDWGLAVSLRDESEGRLPLARDAVEMAGTPCYMAPEMLGGQAERLSERTDVYLLGAILYEIVSGSPPHRGTELMALVGSIVLSNPQLPPGVPSLLARAIVKAMAREPEQRHTSVAELRAEVEAYLLHRGSMRLADRAVQIAGRLADELDDGRLDDEAHRRAVYAQFAECRFAFRAALGEWEGNEAARGGLAQIVLRLCEAELATGDPRSAATLLAELDHAPPALAARVRAEVEKRRDAEERLAAITRELDPTTGTRTRAFLGGVLGTVWTTVPFVAQWADRQGRFTNEVGLAGSVMILGFALALAVWARDSMTKTEHNRRVLASVGVVLVAQVMLRTAGLIMHVSTDSGHLYSLFLWAISTAFIVIHVERRLLLPAVSFSVGFLLAAWRREWVYEIASVTNGILTLSAVWVWFPRGERVSARGS